MCPRDKCHQVIGKHPTRFHDEGLRQYACLLVGAGHHGNLRTGSPQAQRQLRQAAGSLPHRPQTDVTFEDDFGNTFDTSLTATDLSIGFSYFFDE